jgi:hypothetical protein
MIGCARPLHWSPSSRYEQNDRSLPRVPYNAFLRTRFKDIGLELQFLNLIDDFRIGQRRNVAGILVVRDRGKHPTHDLAGASLRHSGRQRAEPVHGCRVLVSDFAGRGVRKRLPGGDRSGGHGSPFATGGLPPTFRFRHGLSTKPCSTSKRRRRGQN